MVNEVKQIEPKLLPFKCPVCNGWGTLGYVKKPCHACKGKGFILVEQTEKDFYESDNSVKNSPDKP